MITVDKLTRHFLTGGKTLVAVNQLSFSVAAGEVFGLLGPNGAGKTTTLRMILGLLHPTSGDATVDGFAVSRFPDEVKRRIGLVSASAGLYQWLTPREMLLFFADLYSVPPSSARERLESLADLLDLRGFLDQRCSTLSTGQKQRVTLARALMHDPPIMLLDEPTRGVDVGAKAQIHALIMDLAAGGAGVLLISSELPEILHLSSRIIVLRAGRLVGELSRAHASQDALMRLMAGVDEAGTRHWLSICICVPSVRRV